MSLLDLLRKAPKWPQSAAACEAELERAANRVAKVEAELVERREQFVARAFADGAAKGDKRIAELGDELQTAGELRDALTAELEKLREKEAAAALAAEWDAIEALADEIREDCSEADKHFVAFVRVMLDRVRPKYARLDAAISQRSPGYLGGIDLARFTRLTTVGQSDGALVETLGGINIVRLKAEKQATIFDLVNERLLVALGWRKSERALTKDAAVNSITTNKEKNDDAHPGTTALLASK